MTPLITSTGQSSAPPTCYDQTHTGQEGQEVDLVRTNVSIMFYGRVNNWIICRGRDQVKGALTLP